MKILYIGRSSLESTSRHRADALSRLGHEVVLVDPYVAFIKHLKGRIRVAAHYRTGYRLIQGAVCTWVDSLLHQYKGWPEAVWVNGGELFGADAVNRLRCFGVPLLLYNNDDPTGGRDGRQFDSLLKALPFYDLSIVLREPNVNEYRALGARAVHRVWMSYDEIMHRPFDTIGDIPPRFRSEVSFVGTCLPREGRDSFLLSLIKRGVPLSIWGDNWERSPNWLHIKHCWRGPSIYGREYVAAIQGSKISLGLLSKGNRDLHTRRSTEIPFAGGLLCAERNSEHLQMYREGEEAVFWDNADECAEVCLKLLADDLLRVKIREEGMTRVREGGYGNEAICSRIISALGKI